MSAASEAALSRSFEVMSKLLGRRSFLIGLGAALAAPSIVKAASLMPTKSFYAPALDEIVVDAYPDRTPNAFRTIEEANAWQRVLGAAGVGFFWAFRSPS